MEDTCLNFSQICMLYRACKSRARKRGWGQLGAGILFSMLTYRTSFCFWL